MNKLIKIFSVLLFTWAFSFQTLAITDTGAVPPEVLADSSEPLPTPSQSPFIAENVHQHVRTCAEAEQTIKKFCSENPDLIYAQQKQGFFQFLKADRGNMSESVENGQTIGRSTLASLSEIKRACLVASNRCLSTCREDHLKHIRYANQLHSEQRYNEAKVQNDLANKKTEIGKMCKAENEKLAASATGMQNNIAEVLTSLAALAKTLGMGKGGDSATLAGLDEDEEQDECDGPYATYLIKCNGQSGPKGTRSGLNNVAALTGSPNSGLPIGAAAESGEPGGTSKDDGSGNNFAASGLGSGLGGGAFGSGSGTGTGAEVGAEKAGLDTDIHKGTYGVGGGSGGGGGGYSSGSRKPFYGSSGTGVKAASLNQAALARKIGKYKSPKRPSRGLSSTGGANGPFEDNWSIVNKAYKKNSSSMFHQ